jgi:hypothetical protein
MVIKAVAFDFGHTLIDERKDDNVPLASRPIHLMPEVCEVLPLPLVATGSLGEHTHRYRALRLRICCTLLACQCPARAFNPCRVLRVRTASHARGQQSRSGQKPELANADADPVRKAMRNNQSQGGVGKLGTHTMRHSYRSWLDAVGTLIPSRWVSP